MIVALLVIALVLALAVAAFSAGIETGFFSVNRGRVVHMAREGSAAAKTLERAIGDMPRTLTTLLVGNNLAAVVFSSASAALAARAFPDSAWGRTAWSVAAAFTVLYLSEFLPKLFCASRPLARLLRGAKAFRVFSAVLSPLTAVAVWFTGLFIPKAERKTKITTSDLLRILQDRKDGVKLTDFESALISRLLVLRRKGMFVTTDTLLEALDEDENAG